MTPPRFLALAVLTACTGPGTNPSGTDPLGFARAPVSTCLAFASGAGFDPQALSAAGLDGPIRGPDGLTYSGQTDGTVSVTHNPEVDSCRVRLNTALIEGPATRALTASMANRGWQPSGRQDAARLFSRGGETLRVQVTPLADETWLTFFR